MLLPKQLSMCTISDPLSMGGSLRVMVEADGLRAFPSSDFKGVSHRQQRCHH